MSDKRVGVKCQLLKGVVLILMVCWNHRCCLCCASHKKENMICQKYFAEPRPVENLDAFRKDYVKTKQKLLVLSTCGHMMRDEGGIIMGKMAPSKWWPWQVSLKTDNSYCGGALITSEWILTAAHCTMRNRLVVAGSHNLASPLSSKTAQFREIAQHYMHEAYDPASMRNDIMLIKLTKPLRITENVSPICLSNATTDFSKASECYVLGWGRDQVESDHLPYDLQQIQVDIMDTHLCAIQWIGYPVSVSHSTICLQQFVNPISGPCQGDSGGPLSCNLNGVFYVAGVVSVGSGTRLKGLCTGVRPDLFTRISSYRDWIEWTIAKNT